MEKKTRHFLSFFYIALQVQSMHFKQVNVSAVGRWTVHRSSLTLGEEASQATVELLWSKAGKGDLSNRRQWPLAEDREKLAARLLLAAATGGTSLSVWQPRDRQGPPPFNLTLRSSPLQYQQGSNNNMGHVFW